MIAYHLVALYTQTFLYLGIPVSWIAQQKKIRIIDPPCLDDSLFIGTAAIHQNAKTISVYVNKNMLHHGSCAGLGKG